MTKINDTRGAKGFPNNTDFNPLFKAIDLDVRELDSLIYAKGVRVLIYDILPCPNVKSIDGREHEINCKVCNGSGYVDVNPRETITFSQSYSKDLLKSPEGIITEWEEGAAYFSFLSGINLSYFSKVVVQDYAKPYYEHIQRQAGNADRARYPIFSVNSLMDDSGKVYNEDVDFEIEEGMIKWLPNKAPKKGTIYSTNYHTAVVYRCISALHQGRYGTNGEKSPDYKVTEYPEQWKVKLDYLIPQTRSDGSVIEPNKIINPEELFPSGE